MQSQNLARIARSFALPNLRSCFNSNKSDRRQDSANVDDSDEVCRLGVRISIVLYELVAACWI